LLPEIHQGAPHAQYGIYFIDRPSGNSGLLYIDRDF
jgi:hypothetical protein